jgi:pyruvate formate lyase activating enzyme
MHQALYYTSEGNKKIQCHLCPHNCIIQDGKTGICRQRKNIEGVLYSLNYAQVASINLDPMEKKPLYHFYPGEQILSIGTNGCNLSCQFCQNWSISQSDSPTEIIKPEEVIKLAHQYNSGFIAYTYNEPLIWYEYVLETARLSQKSGIKNVLVTNAHINKEPLGELLPYISAMNIDVKSIRSDFYRRLCKAGLEPVLEAAKCTKKTCHIEITNLVITGENDTETEIEELALWIATHLGKDTPLHLSAYFPAYKLNNPPTPIETLLKAYEIARKHLYFVYIGNVAGIKEGRDTMCYQCGNKLIERNGYNVKILSLTKDGLCGKCGNKNTAIRHIHS